MRSVTKSVCGQRAGSGLSGHTRGELASDFALESHRFFCGHGRHPWERAIDGKPSPAAIAVVHVRRDLPWPTRRSADEQDELAGVWLVGSRGIRPDDI